ncbi:MAG: hypothetical protein ACJA2S_001994 [Cyclobacteriaceae bacterium]
MIKDMFKSLKYLLYSGLITSISLMVACGEEKTSEFFVKDIVIVGEYISDGTNSQMTAIITPSNASNQEVEWTVSDQAIATISSAGLLTAVANGNVKVTASALDGSSVSIDRLIGVSGVFEPPVQVQSITISGTDITDGKSQQLSVEVLPVNAENKDVVWSVSDITIATVNDIGKLSPVKNGVVMVKASSQDGSTIVGEIVVNISGVDESIVGTMVETAAELLTALSNVVSGEKIYIKSGTYQLSAKVQLSRDGQDGSLISLLAHPNNETRPLIDFSSMSENSSNRGLNLSGDYWYVKGLDVFGAGDNGMFISGHNNLVEFCTFYENKDSGLQIGNGASNNTIINCDSYFNADSSIENADGFACKLDAGTGNKFIGCRAWQNLDDGWDGYLRSTDNITTTYENCWAFKNGLLKNGNVGGGDGNGFKTGGSDDKTLKHNATFTNCIAAGNVYDGFDHNSNRGDITMYNCSSHKNGRNINFGSNNIANFLKIKNMVSFASVSGNSYNASTTDVTNNSWQNDLSTTVDDFVSLDIDLLLSPRKEDGSLPDIEYLKLVSGSDLIDKGVNVGLPFNGTAPDLGAFEFGN